MTYTELHTYPLCTLKITADETAVLRIDFAAEDEQITGAGNALTAQAAKELGEYFAGTRKEFGVPLRPEGTPFRMKVWAELQKIPYGQTISYGELARRIGQQNASRAVGGANHHNPITIVIPCHRVVGSDGSLTGYAGGESLKKALLDLERANMG